MAKEKLTPADNKFIEKFLNRDGKLNFDAGVTFKRRNSYSGAEVEVDPICAAAIDFILKVEVAMQCSENALKAVHPDLKMSNAVSNFDRARYIVMKLDGKAYSALLD
jgi:hypothetical protein